ncbi:MAG: SPFH domain-containing protein [Deltaproteobacteria bacterium]|nr:SPFH domain-containing protein [Deltaproteobacteria bacterium]
MIHEKTRAGFDGPLMFGVLLLASVIDAYAFYQQAQRQDPIKLGVAVLCGAALLLAWKGFTMVNPNEAQVLQLFGSYTGTVKASGLRWVNPLATRRKVSLRAVSFESSHLKVNDLDGNPIEIAAIVVWRVVDTAKASFEVDSHAGFVQVQSEAALRNLATRYAYDAHDDKRPSLRGHTAEIAEHLRVEVQEKVNLAGVEIIDARISHLAYAPEIAQAMLQRQQADAIIAARQKIVDGAVGMVEMALERLSRNQTVQLNEDRKAAMVSNLLVVLCGERSTIPTVNAGSS